MNSQNKVCIQREVGDVPVEVEVEEVYDKNSVKNNEIRFMLRTMKSVGFINWWNKIGHKDKGLSLRDSAKIYLSLQH